MSVISKASLVLIPSGYGEDVLYSEVPNTTAGDFTFTRASSGTRVNADGYIEEVPWNMLQYSEDYTQWLKSSNTTLVGSQTSPINTSTAYALQHNGTTAEYWIQKPSIPLPSANVTVSAYLKKGTKNWVVFRVGNICLQYFDIENEVLGNNIFGDPISYNFVDVGNDWVRLDMTVLGNGGNNGIQIYSAESGSSGQTTGTSGDLLLYVWGVQLVKGNSPKPYIKTTDRLDVPRLDYSGGASCPTLLLEGQRTNLVTYSEDFSQWGTLGANVIEYVSTLQNPDGLLGGYKVKGSGIYLSASLSATTQRSIYARSVSGSGDVQLMTHNSNTNNVFTLTEEWQRFDLNSVTSSTGETNFYIDLRGASSTLSELYVWGAMAETGSFPTSYIPTSGTSVTRTLESGIITSATNLIGQTQGTLYSEFDLTEDNNFTIVEINLGNSTSNRILAYRGTSNIQFVVQVGGAIEINNPTPVTFLDTNKIAVTYQTDDFKIYLNGSLVRTYTSGNIPSGFDTIDLQDNNLNGRKQGVKSLAIFKEILTSTELETLTTI